MGLMEKIYDDPGLADSKSVFQIVNMCGAGELKDINASEEFRTYLSVASLDKLSEYMNQVLSKLPKERKLLGGSILQDLVNTLGIILGYDVEFGCYTSGHDGYWKLGNHHLVIEVKTTDVYVYQKTIDTLLEYSVELSIKRKLNKAPPVLLVVGRFDVGGVEALIRGNRADDRISVISATSLFELTRSYKENGGSPIAKFFRSVLAPRDHTRLDYLCNIIGEICEYMDGTLTESKKDSLDNIVNEENEDIDTVKVSPIQEANKLREKIIISIENSKNISLEKITKAYYSDMENKGYLILVSGRSDLPEKQYWYKFGGQRINQLGENGGTLVLGLKDKDYYFIIPHNIILGNLQYLKSVTGGYFFMDLTEDSDNNIKIEFPKSANNLDITPYKNKL